MLEIIKDVKVIKTAILKSRYIAARLANGEMLKLYFAIGGYVSTNSRNGHWGTGAIDEISAILQKELPGLRGGSAQNMRNMRQFFEEWAPLSICQTQSSKMETSPDSPVSLSDKDLLEIRQPLADELGTGDASAFMSVGFSHHMAIIRACKSSDERLFYIRKAASDFWSYRVLLQHIRANDYATQGKAVNNFALTMPDDKQVSRAVQAFKGEYLLDFVNIVDAADDEETLDEPEWMMEMVSKIRRFIQALGPDFCFMAVKKHFIVDEEEYFAEMTSTLMRKPPDTVALPWPHGIGARPAKDGFCPRGGLRKPRAERRPPHRGQSCSCTGNSRPGSAPGYRRGWRRHATCASRHWMRRAARFGK